MLEETGLEYKVIPINLTDGEQKKPGFLKMNPNGKIPVIRDIKTGQVVFESGAILLYLAEKNRQLYPQEKKYEILQ